jgi:hypothetical protein
VIDELPEKFGRDVVDLDVGEVLALGEPVGELPLAVLVGDVGLLGVALDAEGVTGEVLDGFREKQDGLLSGRKGTIGGFTSRSQPS